MSQLQWNIWFTVTVSEVKLINKCGAVELLLTVSPQLTEVALANVCANGANVACSITNVTTRVKL